MPAQHYLPFEKDIMEMETILEKLESQENDAISHANEIQDVRKNLQQLMQKIFNNLNSWQIVQVSRHPQRPQFLDYVDLIFEDFVELHGDHAFGDDRSIRTGFARLGDYKVMLIGHHKGRNLKERNECLFGCAHPEGYRKALNRMKLAAKYHLPVICLIDTPGAYPGIGAEERGQAQMIATNLLEMARIPTPIVCVVIGEGGSGGALGIGIGNYVGMLQYAYYSVISPEGCAGILWKAATDETKEKAAHALRLNANDLLSFGVIDEILEEPLGGAHRNPQMTATTLKSFLLKSIKKLSGLSRDELLDQRYSKFRQMGEFLTVSDNSES